MEQAIQSGPRKYIGEVAEGYNAKRENNPKWHAENRILKEFIADLQPGTTVLDVPVGTGRFIPFYEDRGFHVLGLDISDDMLKEAAYAAYYERSPSMGWVKVPGKGENVFLRNGDARDLDLADSCYDVAVCVRLFRWLRLDEVVRVLLELQRVASKRIIFNARVANHPYARPVNLILGSLLPEWEVKQTEEIEPDYLMFMLGRQ